MFRRLSVIVLLGMLILIGSACTNKKVKNPLADVGSKQPDKVLFDRSVDAMQHKKYDVARLSLQTLINTYPDSEYVARAKLGIADSWYAEGGTAALAQAENEYKDFITFFPNMPEAAEAQLKVADIHYRQMEKPDRDYTHAKRAEEEYRQVLLQFPDSKLADTARAKLLEVQEVLADREFRIGRFYYMKESWTAGIARLKSLDRRISRSTARPTTRCSCWAIPTSVNYRCCATGRSPKLISRDTPPRTNSSRITRTPPPKPIPGSLLVTR